MSKPVPRWRNVVPRVSVRATGLSSSVMPCAAFPKTIELRNVCAGAGLPPPSSKIVAAAREAGEGPEAEAVAYATVPYVPLRMAMTSPGFAASTAYWWSVTACWMVGNG